jgi:hypothetical protein
MKFTKRFNKIRIYWFFALLFSINSFSQTKNTTIFTEQFEQYHVHALPEKLFVHTDKSFYLAGEIIWFKVYAVDGLLNKPLDFSKVAYIEILDQQHKAIMQTKIVMDDAGGNGSFVIPFTIASGNYKLRAYTKWMKNFSPDFFYEQPITIVNTLKDNQNTVPGISKNYDIQFFPEGGNLVYGVQSKLAFKVVNQNGDAIDCSGYLINQKKDTIAHFATLKFGIGSLLFLPQKEEVYTAIINLPDTTIKKQITGILTEGYTMQVQNSTNDSLLKIIVRSTSKNSNPTVYFFAHTRHLIKNVQENFLSNGETFFIVDTKKLGDGITHFTIFNGDKQPVCERLYFKKPEIQLDIQLVADKAEYTTRSKALIEVVTKDNAGKIANADMSMSVFKIDSCQSGRYNDISSYLLLSSELTGRVDSPEYYFDNTGAGIREAADNLMLTQGWRRFKWDAVLENKKPFFKFIPELEGAVADGTILNKTTGRPASNISTFLSLPDKRYTFKTSTSNANGYIGFTVKDVYGMNDIVLQTNYLTDSIYKFEITNPYASAFSDAPLPSFSLSDKWKKDLPNRSINVQADNAYRTDKKQRSFLTKKFDISAFYGLPDKQYNLDDYTRFVTMEEVIKEYILDVRIKKRFNDFQLRVFNTETKSFFDNAPLILLDGMPVFNTNKLMAFSPLKIKKIEIAEKKYLTGDLINEGIVSLKTYDGDLGGYQLDPNAIIFEYEGLQQEREFYSPVYENIEQVKNRMPDFRNQLFWLPALKTTVNNKTPLSFYTSDVTGRFVIVIQGITKQGLAGSKAISFNVVLPKNAVAN